MKNILLILAVLLSIGCSNPVSPDPAQISAKINGIPLEMAAWSQVREKELEICCYDSTHTIRIITDDHGIGLYPAFLQYQSGVIVYTATRADVLITELTNDNFSCGISFCVFLDNRKIEGTIKIDRLEF